jgi:hypothetical protein
MQSVVRTNHSDIRAGEQNAILTRQTRTRQSGIISVSLSCSWTKPRTWPCWSATAGRGCRGKAESSQQMRANRARSKTENF